MTGDGLVSPGKQRANASVGSRLGMKAGNKRRSTPKNTGMTNGFPQTQLLVGTVS